MTTSGRKVVQGRGGWFLSGRSQTLCVALPPQSTTPAPALSNSAAWDGGRNGVLVQYKRLWSPSIARTHTHSTPPALGRRPIGRRGQ